MFIVKTKMALSTRADVNSHFLHPPLPPILYIPISIYVPSAHGFPQREAAARLVYSGAGVTCPPPCGATALTAAVVAAHGAERRRGALRSSAALRETGGVARAGDLVSTNHELPGIWYLFWVSQVCVWHFFVRGDWVSSRRMYDVYAVCFSPERCVMDLASFLVMFLQGFHKFCAAFFVRGNGSSAALRETGGVGRAGDLVRKRTFCSG